MSVRNIKLTHATMQTARKSKTTLKIFSLKFRLTKSEFPL